MKMTRSPRPRSVCLQISSKISPRFCPRVREMCLVQGNFAWCSLERYLNSLTSWFPTMVLNIDFKFPIPRSSSDYASRTVGLYSSGHFINDPQGRHNQYTEVWTAPCNLGEGGAVDGWRDKQVCLATSTQMALVMPMEVNRQRGAKL